MGRYRPPAPAKSPYVTASGYRLLQAEEERLWVERREVVIHLSAAAAEGDRSENAEYIYRKKQLREIDRRIRYLQKRIPELQIVDRVPSAADRVFFGAEVSLETEDGACTYRIVGADEFDPKRQWISIDSPMARALLGKGLDDEIEVRTPGGLVRGWIAAIRYESGGS